MKSPTALTSLLPRIDARLENLLDAEIATWAEVDPDLVEPLGTLRDCVMAGGKRLRPAFCYWAFVGAGGDAKDPAIIDAAAALELLHTAALVHDDVIDGSARRHGADTVHVAYAGSHRHHEWRGDDARYGIGVAILIGDLALAYAGRLMAGAPRAALTVFDDLRLEVNIGQYLDVLGAAHGVGDDSQAAVDRARRICRYKTAKYTIERPLHLGAALAAPKRLAELRDPLSMFGLPLGEAFQLRDDLLGVFGDPHVTGKPVGDDLREGKPTLLAGLAAGEAAGEEAQVFSKLFGTPNLTMAEIERLQGIIESSGARTEVEEGLIELLATAKQQLSALPLTAEAIAALGELAAFVVGRDH